MGIEHIFEAHPHWQDIVQIMSKMTKAGHTVYLAGGCVRDALLGLPPHDFDIATSAHPEAVQKIFPHALDVGRQFGVMIVPMSGYQVEITTFRLDGEYRDGRHPQTIQYSRPEEDARRRDFTVNALFYDIATKKVIDYVGGQGDLHKKILKAVGEPERRFTEDKLRMLRAARFTAQLGFTVEERTLAAISEMSAQIAVVSRERITDEIRKMIKTKHPEQGLQLLKDTGLLAGLFKNFQFQNSPLWPAFLQATIWIAPIQSFELFLATTQLFELFHSHKAPKLDFVLSRENERRIQFLTTSFLKWQDSNSKLEELLLLLNEEDGPLLSELCYNMSVLGFLEKDSVSRVIARFLELSDHHGYLPQPWLDGNDLKQLGVAPSKKMGDLLREVYHAQLRGEVKNKKSAQEWVLLRADS